MLATNPTTKQGKGQLYLEELLSHASACYQEGHYEKALTVYQMIMLQAKMIPPSLWIACAACLAELGHVSECLLVVQYVCKRQISRELRLEALIVAISTILNESLVKRNTGHLLLLEDLLFALKSLDENHYFVFLGHVFFLMQSYALDFPQYWTQDYIEAAISQSLLAEFYYARLLHMRGDVATAGLKYEELYRSAEILHKDTSSDTSHSLYEHYKAIYNGSLEGMVLCELHTYYTLKGTIEMSTLGYLDRSTLQRNGNQEDVEESRDQDKQDDPRLMHKSTSVELRLSRLRSRMRLHSALLFKNGITLTPTLTILVSFATQDNSILMKHVTGSINPLAIMPIIHLNRFSYTSIEDYLTTLATLLSYLAVASNQSGMPRAKHVPIQYIKLLDHAGYRSVFGTSSVGRTSEANTVTAAISAFSTRLHELPYVLAPSSKTETGDLSAYLVPMVPNDISAFFSIIREGLFEDSFGHMFVTIFPELFYNVALATQRMKDSSTTFTFFCISVYASIVRTILLGADPAICSKDPASIKASLMEIEDLVVALHQTPGILETRDDIMQLVLHAPLDTCYALCYFYRNNGYTRAALKLAITLSHLYFTPKLPIFIADMLRTEGVTPAILVAYLLGPKTRTVLNTAGTQGHDTRVIWNAETLSSVHPRLLAYLSIMIDPLDNSESLTVYQKALSSTLKAQGKNKMSQLFCVTAMVSIVATKLCYYIAQKYLIRNLHHIFGTNISLFSRIAKESEDVVRFCTKIILGLNEKLGNYEKTVDYYFDYVDTRFYAKTPSFDYMPTTFNLRICLANLASAKAALCGINSQAVVNMTCLLNHISSATIVDLRVYLHYMFTTGCLHLGYNNGAAVSYLANTLISGLLACQLPRANTDSYYPQLLLTLAKINEKYADVLGIYRHLSSKEKGSSEQYADLLTSPDTEAVMRRTVPAIPLSLFLYFIMALHASGNSIGCLWILNSMLLQYPLLKYPMLSYFMVMILEASISSMNEFGMGRNVKRLRGALQKIVSEQQLNKDNEYGWLFGQSSIKDEQKEGQRVIALEIETMTDLCADLKAVTNNASLTNETILRLSKKHLPTPENFVPLNILQDIVTKKCSDQLSVLSRLRTTFSANLDSLAQAHSSTLALFRLSANDVEMSIFYLMVLTNLIAGSSNFSHKTGSSSSSSSTVAQEAPLFNTPTYPWISSTFPRFLSKLGSSRSTFAIFLTQETDYNSYYLETLSMRFGVPAYVESFMRSYMSFYKFPLVRKLTDSYQYYAKELDSMKRMGELLKQLRSIEKTLIRAIIVTQTTIRDITTKSSANLDIYIIARQNKELERKNREALGLDEPDARHYGEKSRREPPGKLRVQTSTGTETPEDRPWDGDTQNNDVGVGSDSTDGIVINAYEDVYAENNLLNPHMPMNLNDINHNLDDNDDDI